MCTILEMMKRLEELDMQKIASQAIEETRQELIDWQRGQLSAGKQSDGNDIDPPYKPRTRKYKIAQGLSPDIVTLHDDGPFYAGIFVDVRDTTFVIDSSDEKTAGLVAKYGVRIFGLAGLFKLGYVQDLQPVLLIKVKEYLKV